MSRSDLRITRDSLRDPAVRAEIERRIREQPEADLDDPDNPEWTEEDFARAVGPEGMSEAELAAFPRTRGPQRAPKKKLVSIRLDPDVIDHFKAGGPGWQVRLNAALRSLLPTTS